MNLKIHIHRVSGNRVVCDASHVRVKALCFHGRSAHSRKSDKSQSQHRKTHDQAIIAYAHPDAQRSEGSPLPRLAVFVSGGGSNFRAIHAAILDGRIKADVAVGLFLCSPIELLATSSYQQIVPSVDTLANSIKLVIA